MKHLKDVNGISSKDLGRALASLDYSALQDVMHELNCCLVADLIMDSSKGRNKLADALCKVSDAIDEVEDTLKDVAEICKPYNES